MVRLSDEDRKIFTILKVDVPESADGFPDVSVVGKSFRRLSLKCHPDKNPSPEARQEFEELHQAYDTFVDDEKFEALKSRMFGLGPTGVRSAAMETAASEHAAAAARAAAELKRREREAAAANKREEHQGKQLQDGLKKLFYDSAASIEDDMVQRWEVDNWGMVQEKEMAILHSLLKRPRGL